MGFRRDLSGLDTDINQALGRVIQQAFKYGIDCDIIHGGLLEGCVEQGIYEQSATQKYVIGSKRRLPDGREFIYAKAGGVALGKALMCEGPVGISNYREQVQTGYGWAAGAKSGTILITTGATPAVDAWKDGYMVVNKGTGLGQLHKIKSNTSHATIPTVTLYDAIVAAFAATAEVTIIANPFNGTIVCPVTTLTSPPAGIPLIAVDIGYYYWSQVKGPAPITVDTGDTLVIGEPCASAGTNAVAGAAGPAVTLEGHYGKVLYIGTADEIAIVQLDLGW